MKMSRPPSAVRSDSTGRSDDTGGELSLCARGELLVGRGAVARPSARAGPEGLAEPRPPGCGEHGRDDKHDDEGLSRGHTEQDHSFHSGALPRITLARPHAHGKTAGVPALDAVVGLGSNLGDRRAILRLAVERLASRSRVTAVSPVYESPPLGPPQPAYLNAAVRLEWPGSSFELLAALLAIEASLGRARRVRWGPRTLDLDILWIDGVALDTPELTVPHPGLTQRAFALVPLLDVAPGARHPSTGRLLATDLAPGARDSLVVVAVDASWARW
jgi:2-amino-4-hydroxy-6-hydroxymethyldihydropteridine diphosphokinase